MQAYSKSSKLNSNMKYGTDGKLSISNNLLEFKCIFISQIKSVQSNKNNSSHRDK